MRDQLEQLGLRLVGDFTLHSGKKSSIFWDIERLFRYPKWVRMKAIEPFIWEVGMKNPELLIGIRTGGLRLARDISECLNIYLLNQDNYVEVGVEAGRKLWGDGKIIVDDVLTTGGTIKECLKKFKDIIAIAVLVNRSGLTDIEGISIISGIVADEVE